jgi:DNA-binding response OmpR family regulator
MEYGTPQIGALKSMRILVIEDEPRMAALLRKGLSENGHSVATALNAADGLKSALDEEFDVILLDVGLPDLSGYDIAQVLRERDYPALILMLTAYNKEDQIVRGLNLGADDYLTKPFSFPELLARLRAITRGVAEQSARTLSVGDLVIDTIRRRITRQLERIELTRTEYLLLELLARHSPSVVSRSALTAGIWGSEQEVGPGALDVLVNSLRSKIDVPFSEKLVHTIRGAGYLLREGLDGRCQGGTRLQ